MTLLRIKNSTFRRIGDSLGHYFDGDHFMGQTSMEGDSPKKNERESRSIKIDIKK